MTTTALQEIHVAWPRGADDLGLAVDGLRPLPVAGRATE